MTRNALDRRRFLGATAASLSAVLVAGCSDDEPAPDDGGDGGDDDDGGDAGADGIAIDPGTEIEIDGYVEYWEGTAPGDIAGEENPTLVLEEGAEYTMTWTNADSVLHDLQIWDDGGDLVDDLATEEIDGEGESASLEFEASTEMARYVCEFHQGTQSGDIVVE